MLVHPLTVGNHRSAVAACYLVGLMQYVLCYGVAKTFAVSVLQPLATRGWIRDLLHWYTPSMDQPPVALGPAIAATARCVKST